MRFCIGHCSTVCDIQPTITLDLPVIMLEMMSGRMTSFSIRMRISPGKPKYTVLRLDRDAYSLTRMPTPIPETIREREVKSERILGFRWRHELLEFTLFFIRIHCWFMYSPSMNLTCIPLSDISFAMPSVITHTRPVLKMLVKHCDDTAIRALVPWTHSCIKMASIYFDICGCAAPDGTHHHLSFHIQQAADSFSYQLSVLTEGPICIAR